jgi:hypothetical protein
MAVGWVYREGWGLACERDDEAGERRAHRQKRGEKQRQDQEAEINNGGDVVCSSGWW